MLSILIPTYYYNVTNLVQRLHQQAVGEGIDFEILLLLNGSDTELVAVHQALNSLQGVKLLELPTMAARSVARNFLAGQAKHDYLLFIDCDSEMVDDRFIERYLPHCETDNVVVCGGTAYKKQKPQANSYLRWAYGVKTEEKSAAIRNTNPNARFSTFNFLISRTLFLSIRFNELLKNYGHEDTIFGLELKERGVEIRHIDNPLYHLGIDANKIYLQKTRQGVKNLKILLENYPNQQELTHNIRLLRYYNFLEKTYTTIFFFGLYASIKHLMLLNFHSRYPSLTLFNLYKLGYLCELKYRKHVELTDD
ncbi:MAG: glycosyltransferase [Lentimicrobiaceae bacterium]|nr:glycosyltransferase [Lentimicrobiaceae bacterium]